MPKNLPADVLDRAFWNRLWQDLMGSFLHSALHVAVIIISYLVIRALLFRLIDGALRHLLSHERWIGVSEERAGRLQTLQGLCKSVLSYVLFFVFGVMLFDAIGFNIMPFVETAGVVGLAIGFGAQKLVKDVISGFFIIVDDLFVVGDVITIGAVTGQVQEIGMRVTRLMDPGGRLYVFSNGDIGTLTNLSRHPITDSVEITVASNADLSFVVKIVQETGERLFAEENSRLKAAPAVMGISAFTGASITVRISVTAEPRDLIGEQMRLREALRAALVAANVPLV